MKISFAFLFVAVAFVAAVSIEFDQPENDQNTIDSFNTDENEVAKSFSSKASDIFGNTVKNSLDIAIKTFINGPLGSYDFVKTLDKFVKEIEENPNYKIDIRKLNVLENIFAKAVATVYKIADRLHIPHGIINDGIMTIASNPLLQKGYGTLMIGFSIASGANELVVETFDISDEEIDALAGLPIHLQLKGIGVLVGKKVREEVENKILGSVEIVKVVPSKVMNIVRQTADKANDVTRDAIDGVKRVLNGIPKLSIRQQHEHEEEFEMSELRN